MSDNQIWALKRLRTPCLNVYFYLLPFSISRCCKTRLWFVASHLTAYVHICMYDISSVYSQNTSVWYHRITFKSQCCTFSCFHVIRPKSKTAFLFVRAKPLLSLYNVAVLVGNKSEKRGEVLCGLRWRKAQQLLRM